MKESCSLLSFDSLIFSSELLPLYFSGEITAKEYAYCGAVSMFVYYFLSHRDEDLEILLNSLKGDPQKLNHLENIRKSMKRETVSMSRLGQTMSSNIPIVREIVSNFGKKFNPASDPNGWKEQANAIREKILKTVENDQDKEILDMMVRFNEAIVKTNFFKVPKTSISFRIDPHLLQWEKTYPDVPFGIFLFVGNDFHGFHVRFNDIARGGLRLVLSRDKASFTRNMETTFFENYNLAHTQNRKNKGASGREDMLLDSYVNLQIFLSSDPRASCCSIRERLTR